jgi:hypothetical protein
LANEKRRVAKNAGEGKPWIDESLIFPGIEEYINRLAEGFNLPPAIVIQNMIIRRIAEEDATTAVYGKRKLLLFEFTELDGELITGQELYERLYSAKKNELERELYQRLKKVPKEDLHRLSEKDQDIIRRYAPSSSRQDIKEQLQAEGDDVNDTEWTSEINPEDLK